MSRLTRHDGAGKQRESKKGGWKKAGAARGDGEGGARALPGGRRCSGRWAMAPPSAGGWLFFVSPPLSPLACRSPRWSHPNPPRETEPAGSPPQNCARPPPVPPAGRQGLERGREKVEQHPPPKRHCHAVRLGRRRRVGAGAPVAAATPQQFPVASSPGDRAAPPPAPPRPALPLPATGPWPHPLGADRGRRGAGGGQLLHNPIEEEGGGGDRAS